MRNSVFHAFWPLFLLSINSCSKDNVIDQSQNTSCENCYNNVSNTFNPSGGELVSQGKIKLTIPAGALKNPAQITIRDASPGEYTAAPSGKIDTVVAILPHGQAFDVPVTLTMPLPAHSKPLKLWTSAPAGAWQVVSGAQFLDSTVSTPLDHFSFFVLAEDEGGAGAGGAGAGGAGAGGAGAGGAGQAGEAGGAGQSGGGEAGQGGMSGSGAAGTAGAEQGGAGSGGAGQSGAGSGGAGQSGAGSGGAGQSGAGQGGAVGCQGTMCGPFCVDLASDIANCGQCGKTCNPATGDKCIDGKCGCAEAEMLCNSGCSDTKIDALNCGVCGFACKDAEVCENSSCLCKTAVCNGVCSDTLRGKENCGSCGKVCPGVSACDQGTCTPEPDLLVGAAPCPEFSPFWGTSQLIADSSHVYWNGSDGIHRTPLVGGGSSLFSPQAGMFVALREGLLLWRDGIGKVRGKPVDGSGSEVTYSFDAFTVMKGKVWGTQNGVLVSVNPDGTGLKPLVQSSAHIASGAWIYESNSSSVTRINPDTGEKSTIYLPKPTYDASLHAYGFDSGLIVAVDEFPGGAGPVLSGIWLLKDDKDTAEKLVDVEPSLLGSAVFLGVSGDTIAFGFTSQQFLGDTSGYATAYSLSLSSKEIHPSASDILGATVGGGQYLLLHELPQGGACTYGISARPL